MTAKVSDVEGTQLVREIFKEARELERIPWGFGQAMCRQGLEEQALEGLKAIAQLWFLEFTDETRLPDEMMALIETLEHWSIADVYEFMEDDEDDDGEGDGDAG